MAKEHYLAKFEQGYYAEYQPKFGWSFTDDPEKAKKYKSLRNVDERLFVGEQGFRNRNCSYHALDIVKVNIDGTLESIGFMMPEDNPNDPWKSFR